MTPRGSILSTAEQRRPVVTDAALRRFSQRGFHGTTVADVAGEAKISPAYAFKLFPRKESLFVAALDLCFDRILDALGDGADRSADRTPDGILDAMGAAYAELIQDRALLMLQVHAQSVADVPEIGSALRTGLARITMFAKQRSGADDAAVQRFVAYGQLCHLIVTSSIEELPEAWAEILTRGIRH
ncbi:TetR/AcrR family transcriptional regulator [Microbacterium sp. JZ31]|uniref:TetR/AcrR family transcriptional regulator n=1 Tax=Microbacterium sp. JZ31 TaxID=1906274 RepID=UPI00193303C9|nr:TetR/AcrR family transcriptional regulator [Microbacterium sp. JZ31]